MPKKIAVLPGDGVGPEVISSAVAAINTLVSDVELINGEAGYGCFKRTGESLPRMTMELLDECDAVMVGAFITPPDNRYYRDPLPDIKKRTELYVDSTIVNTLVPDMGKVNNLNATFIKENADIYNTTEREDLDGVTLERKVSYSGAKRLCQFVKERMIKQSIGHITCVHMTDEYRLTDGVLLNAFNEVMADSSLRYDDLGANHMAAKMVMDPGDIQAVVSMSPYYDILSQEASTLTGGSYLVPMMSLGDRKAMFKPIHGPLTQLEGLNAVNPTAALLCASYMLRFLGHVKEGKILNESVRSAYKRGYRTADVGGRTGTYDFTTEVVKICESSF